MLRAEVLHNLCPTFRYSLKLRQSMLIMTSIIRVGQSKFATVQIDEDSNERIMNCIKTLSELETENAVQEIFLADTKTAFSRMLGAQEVSAYSTVSTMWQSLTRVDRRSVLWKRRKQRRARSRLCRSTIF
jgi:coatomer subunit beta